MTRTWAGDSLPATRVATGAAGFAVGLTVMLLVLVPRRDDLLYATPVILVLGLVVAASLLGGVRVGPPAALVGALALNWALTPPYGTLRVADSEQLLVLAGFLLVALVVSIGTARSAASATAASQARREAEALLALAGRALDEHASVRGVLEQVRVAFGVREVALVELTDAGPVTADLVTGPETAEPGETAVDVPAGPQALLILRGRALLAEDRRVLAALAEAAGAALASRRLVERAAALESGDRTRRALLAAVGHDLRTPLSALKVAVGGLRAGDVAWSDEERSELLATVEDSADRMQALVDDLLDASRLQAGGVTAQVRAISLAEAVDRAVLALPDTRSADRVHLDLAPLPDVLGDEGLVERILANLLQNALRYSPAGTLVTVTGRQVADQVRCEVVDHGPGLPESSWPLAATAFERLSDRPGGLGLGLTVARGFAEAVGATLTPHPTPGGGLTVRLALPVAS